MSNGARRSKQGAHRGVHIRPLLTPFEAQALLAALEGGTTFDDEKRAGLERAKAKIGRVAKEA